MVWKLEFYCQTSLKNFFIKKEDVLDTHFTKKHKIESKTDEEATTEEEEEAPVPLVTHVNNTLQSTFSYVEVYLNNEQIYKSIGLYAHWSDTSNDVKGASSEYKLVLHCEGYDYEKFHDEIMESLLSEPSSTRRK